MEPPLKLRAEDAEDLAVIATCLQDALVPVGDLTFLPEARQFIGVLNRFCWECASDTPAAERRTEADYQRVLCGLRFDAVRNVKIHGVRPRDAGRLLQLLTIEPSDQAITLVFAEDVAYRLDVDHVQCILEDLVEPWPTRWRPRHGDEADDEPG
ncbi:MAG: DUF2948 family protein [Kiloniellales bacterium]